MRGVDRMAMGVIAVGLTGVLLWAGCGGGDDDPEGASSATVLTTNRVVSGGRTNLVVTTNVPAAAAGQEAASGEAAAGSDGQLPSLHIPTVQIPILPLAAEPLAAPQLLTPENNQHFLLSKLNPRPVPVTFQWTPVAGAVAYHITVNHIVRLIDDGGTVHHGAYATAGRYGWSVVAVDEAGRTGTRSETHSFEIREALLVQ